MTGTRMNRMMKTARRGRSRRQGYTLVEAMAGLLIFGIGMLGIMAMEVVATRGNKDSNDLTVATTMAEWWMERLRMESLMWTTGATNITAADTPMIFPLEAAGGVANVGSTTNWISPPGNPRYDKWMRTATAATDPGEFCTQYRLTTLVQNELLRAEVRVMWWKNPASRGAAWVVCPTGMLDGVGNPDMTRVQNVTLSSVLWRHHFY